MTEQEFYIERYKHISKGMVANMFKAQIRASFPESLASYYCKQVDEAKTLTNIWCIMQIKDKYDIRYGNKIVTV